jgi:TatD DNase family protein
MHKIFPYYKELKKLPAVVFHSWPGTGGEGEALLKRGINVFFSFGTTVLKNHRDAMTCAAFFPPDLLYSQ